MSRPAYAAGIDIGGTRIKMGIVELSTGKIAVSGTMDTEKTSEDAFWASLSAELNRQAAVIGVSPKELSGVGLSVGSYVFADGSIDGMSSFIPFFTHAYPMLEKASQALGLPVKLDNDARLIALAEALYGSGQGFERILSITLGTGVGIGLCVGGKPFGDTAFMHLAGHIKVRSGGELPCLDEPPCYCGQSGCFESTCSGTSLEKYIKNSLGKNVTTQKMFELAQNGDTKALSCLNWYIEMLMAALNQYVYVYCPDIIILGGGISRGLLPFADELNRRMTAEVYLGQHTVIRISSLLEDSGILGGASLFFE